jgi:vacuolar-type H+-ATPase subunit H
MKSDTQAKGNDGSSVFSGGQSRLAEILERELQRLRKEVERESTRVIVEAKQQAQSIVGEAELRARQEIKERVRYETQNLIATAEEESKRIINEARQKAKQQTDQLLANAKQEADIQAKKITQEALRSSEDLTRSATETRQKAEEEAEIIKEKADREIFDIIKEAEAIAKSKEPEEERNILNDAEKRGEAIIEEAREKAKVKYELAASIANEIIQRINQQIKELSEKSNEITQAERNIIKQTVASIEKSTPIKPVTQKVNPPVPTAQSEMFIGSVEIDIVDAADTPELTSLANTLRSIPALRVLPVRKTKTGQEKGFLVLCDAPKPLMDIIQKMPMVKSVRKEDKKILITLLNKAAAPGNNQ